MLPSTGQYPAAVYGFHGTDILFGFHAFDSYDAAYADAYLGTFSLGSPTPQQLAGTNTLVQYSDFCADGTGLLSCYVPPSEPDVIASATFDTDGDGGQGRWLMLRMNNHSIRTLNNGSQTIGTLSTLIHSGRSFAYRRTSSSGRPIEEIYYCAFDDGRIYKRIVGGSTEQALAWPISTLGCAGRSLVFNPDTKQSYFSLSAKYAVRHCGV